MERIDLQAFRPQPHPYKSIFQSNRISQAVIAKYMGVSMSMINHWMNGYCPVPDHHKERLKRLAESVNRFEGSGLKRPLKSVEEDVTHEND